MARNWKRAIGATLRKPQADKSISRVGGARAESNSAPWPKAEVENANQRSIEPSKRNTGAHPTEFMVCPLTLHDASSSLTAIARRIPSPDAVILLLDEDWALHGEISAMKGQVDGCGLVGTFGKGDRSSAERELILRV